MKGTKHDVSVDDLKGQVAGLKDENRILQQMAEYRSVTISRIAHELRTPLTSILGFAEIMLSQEQLSEPQRNFCERIQNSAQQLQTSLSRLADLSRLETSKTELLLEEFALEDLLNETSRAITTEAKRSGINLEIKPAPDLPRVVSDRGKLRQIFRMLLECAIARSEPGGRVVLTVEGADAGCVVRIEAETGLAEAQVTNRFPGSNDLGLAIASHNLVLLGAKLTVTDRDSQGWEILIQLPGETSRASN
jgi:signal transduction histidine kinase